MIAWDVKQESVFDGVKARKITTRQTTRGLKMPKVRFRKRAMPSLFRRNKERKKNTRMKRLGQE